MCVSSVLLVLLLLNRGQLIKSQKIDEIQQNFYGISITSSKNKSPKFDKKLIGSVILGTSMFKFGFLSYLPNFTSKSSTKCTLWNDNLTFKAISWTHGHSSTTT